MSDNKYHIRSTNRAEIKYIEDDIEKSRIEFAVRGVDPILQIYSSSTNMYDEVSELINMASPNFISVKWLDMKIVQDEGDTDDNEVVLTVLSQDAQELLEVLCSIPQEVEMGEYSDGIPHRPPGVNCLIDQLIKYTIEDDIDNISDQELAELNASMEDTGPAPRFY